MWLAPTSAMQRAVAYSKGRTGFSRAEEGGFRKCVSYNVSKPQHRKKPHSEEITNCVQGRGRFPRATALIYL